MIYYLTFSTWPVTIGDGSPQNSSNIPPSELISSQMTSNITLPPPPPLPHISSSTIKQQQMEALGIRSIVLDRAEEGLGFSIVGGFGSNLGDLPIYVKSVFDKGAAAREGTLRRGDQILEVNVQSLAGLTHAQAVAILKEARGAVSLTILPSKS